MSARRPKSIVVVTTCSARKRCQLPDAPGFEELADDQRRASAFRRFAHLAMPARDMYTGQHHQSVMRTVERLRQAWPWTRVEVVVVSAGYGVIDESDLIIPYDATFAGLAPTIARERARRLGIRQRLQSRLGDHEAALLLLSEVYLSVLDPPLMQARSEVYFAAPSQHLAGQGIVHIPAGLEQSRTLGVAPRMVRAALFERFVEVTLEIGWLRAVEMAYRPGELVYWPTSPAPLAFSTP